MFRYAPIGEPRPYTRCYRCGELLGMSRAVLHAYQPSSANLIRLGVDWLRSFREEFAVRWGDGRQSYCQRCGKNSVWKELGVFTDPGAARDEALKAGDLRQLIARASFAVYGLKGNPLGLQLTDLGRGGRGSSQIALRYSAGDPDDPQHALDFLQGSAVVENSPEGRMHAELRAVVGLVLGCAPPGQRKFYQDRHNVHRDWHLDRLRRAPRMHVTFHIDSRPTTVDVASWEEPQRVALAHLDCGDSPALAVSLGISHIQLLALLKGLTPLARDAEALAEHERDYRAGRLGSA